MDPFEQRLKSIALHRPTATFGKPESLRAAIDRSKFRRGFIERIRDMSWISKVAALTGLAASVAVAFVVLAGMPAGSIAFAQVAAKLRSAQTLTFDWAEMRISDGKNLGHGRNMYMVPGKVRVEIEGAEGKSYFIADTISGKVIFVDTKQRTARVVPLSSFQQKDIAATVIEDLKSLDEQGAQSLGKKQIEGVEASGFVVDRADNITTVWVDTSSGNPLRVESRGKNATENPTETVWTDIKLDQPLDLRLFSATPPAGFRTAPLKPADSKSTRAYFVAEFLRIYAKHMSGQFPSRLEDASQKLTEAFESSPENRPAMGEIFPLPMYVASMHSMMRKGMQGTDWQYYPGHKMGEAKELIFWLRERESGQYFGVFGDLRIERVDESRLPAAPQ